VVDLCPVGSLLSKDFLHKARVWDLDKTASVCPGCTQGCNINIDTRDDVVVRLRPRPNLEVNRHFMCDYGRMNYRWLNRGDRVEAPLIREGGRHVATDWDSALARLDQAVRGATGSVVILASGRASVESLGMVRRLVERPKITAAIQVPLGDEAPLAGVPNLALRRERVPNLAGAELLGYGTAWEAAMREVLSAGLVVVLDADLSPADEAALAAAPGVVVVLGTVATDGLRNAQLVLPVTTMAEENGTYVNRDRRIQRYHQARSQPGMARPAWWIAGEVLAGPGPSADAPATAEEAFALVGAAWPVFAGLSYADLGFTGRVLADGRPAVAGAAR
jgi:NADH-quinone oxidoreductase subunit G